MNDITIPTPDNKDVTNIVEAPNEAIQHVVAHEGRITRLEEEQARKFEELVKQIDETRAELFRALESAKTEQAAQLESKLTRLEELATKLENQVVEVPTEAIEDVQQGTESVPLVPEVEGTISQAIPKGLRLRRKNRHRK